MASNDERPAIWRRRIRTVTDREASLVWAHPLRGVGRVPIQAGDRLAVVAYSDVTRTYEWSCLTPDGGLIWRMAVPAGGYALSLHDQFRDVLLGPSGYNGFTELDAATGAQRWTLRFPGAVRSSPAVHAGAYVAAAGNRIARFADGRLQVEHALPGHLTTSRRRTPVV